MSDKEALRIYFSVFSECRRSDYGADEIREIAQAMWDVVAASGPRKAADVIRWWDCWEYGMTCAQAVKRIRAAAGLA